MKALDVAHVMQVLDFCKRPCIEMVELHIGGGCEAILANGLLCVRGRLCNDCSVWRRKADQSSAALPCRTSGALWKLRWSCVWPNVADINIHSVRKNNPAALNETWGRSGSSSLTREAHRHVGLVSYPMSDMGGFRIEDVTPIHMDCLGLGSVEEAEMSSGGIVIVLCLAVC